MFQISHLWVHSNFMKKLSFVRKLRSKLFLYFQNAILFFYSRIDAVIFKNNLGEKNFENICIRYLAYGPKHLEALMDISIPSIFQKGNIPAIIKSGLDVELKLYVKSKQEKEYILAHANFKKIG